MAPGQRMAYMSRYQHEVRSYELDVYNHVNNAVYIQWLEHGRSRLLQDKGLDYTAIVGKWGVRFLTVRTEINYRRALHLGDQVEIRTWVEKVGTTSVTLAHEVALLPGGEVAADAKVVIVYTHAESGLPAPVPEQFVRLYL
jgi:thioesterase III